MENNDEKIVDKEELTPVELCNDKLTKQRQQIYNKAKLLIQQGNEVDVEEEEKMEEKENFEEEIEHKQKQKHEKKVKLETQLNNVIVSLLSIQKKLDLLSKMEEKEEKSQEEMEVIITKELGSFQPSLEQIQTRKQQILQDPNDSNWTDATDSQADDIWVVDDEMLEAMEQSSSQEQQNKEQQSDGQSSEQGQKIKKEDVNFNELEDQFIKGGQSDHHLLFGEHEKFCVSVNGISEKGILVSGGGDDYLQMYKVPVDPTEVSEKVSIKPYHMIKHTETINKIEISNSKEYIFTLTDNEVLCTELKTQETTPLKKRQNVEKEKKENPPICNDICCHHLGDVVALACQNEIQLYNIKGLKIYGSYFAPHDVTQLAFTENGKQLCFVSDDSKIRILTPKSSQIVTVGGTLQHKAEISAMKVKGNWVVSGCIDGYIGISSISNCKMMGMIGTKQTEQVYGSVNQIQFAGNYVMVGTSEEKLGWYDVTKAKKLFTNQLEGSSTDISEQDYKAYPNIYNVSTIKGLVYIYDCRNPLKECGQVRAGNTIHKIWSQSHHIGAACEDGNVRYFDIRKLI